MNLMFGRDSQKRKGKKGERVSRLDHLPHTGTKKKGQRIVMHNLLTSGNRREGTYQKERYESILILRPSRLTGKKKSEGAETPNSLFLRIREAEGRLGTKDRTANSFLSYIGRDAGQEKRAGKKGKTVVSTLPSYEKKGRERTDS